MNCSKVSVMAFLRLAGLRNTGAPDFNALNGNGSTPLIGALSMATVAAAAPLSAIFCTISPPKECPITAGFLLSPEITAR